MKISMTYLFFITLCWLGASSICSASENDPHANHRAMMAKQQNFGGSPTRVDIPDVHLLDSEGNSVSLRHVMKDKPLVVDFVFTSCTTICPVLTTLLQQAQNQLDQKEIEKVQFVSISVDPINDTPAKLRTYSDQRGADNNWLWLTGRPADVNRVLRAFGIATGGRPEEHPPIVLVGDGKQQWSRWVGMPNPTDLVATVRQFSHDDMAGRDVAEVHHSHH